MRSIVVGLILLAAVSASHADDVSILTGCMNACSQTWTTANRGSILSAEGERGGRNEYIQRQCSDVLSWSAERRFRVGLESVEHLAGDAAVLQCGANDSEMIQRQASARRVMWSQCSSKPEIEQVFLGKGMGCRLNTSRAASPVVARPVNDSLHRDAAILNHCLQNCSIEWTRQRVRDHLVLPERERSERDARIASACDAVNRTWTPARRIAAAAEWTVAWPGWRETQCGGTAEEVSSRKRLRSEDLYDQCKPALHPEMFEVELGIETGCRLAHRASASASTPVTTPVAATVAPPPVPTAPVAPAAVSPAPAATTAVAPVPPASCGRRGDAAALNNQGKPCCNYLFATELEASVNSIVFGSPTNDVCTTVKKWRHNYYRAGGCRSEFDASEPPPSVKAARKLACRCAVRPTDAARLALYEEPTLTRRAREFGGRMPRGKSCLHDYGIVAPSGAAAPSAAPPVPGSAPAVH